MRCGAALVASFTLLALGGPAPPGRGQQPSTAAAGAYETRERAYRANNVGVAQLEQFDYKAAEQSFREAIKLQPDLAMARVNLAIAVFYAGRPDEAVVEARGAVKALPDAPQSHYVLGLVARALNDLDEAVAAFERALQLDPPDAGARIQLGQILVQRRRYPEAVRLFQEALAAEPYNVTAAYSAALALTRAGQQDEGRRAMQRFESLRDSAYGVTYSQTYLGQGRNGEALASTGAEPELVSAALPAITFVAGGTPIAAGSGQSGKGGVTLFDADDDGDLDLADTGRGGTRLFRNDGGQFRDDTVRAGTGAAGPGLGVLAGDYGNDGRADLLVLADRGPRLLRQRDGGSFEEVTGPAGLRASVAAPAAAAFADVDHDGDLDILLAGGQAQVLRNNGDGTFADITAAAGLGGEIGGAFAVAPTDFDNRRDIDVLIAAGGRAPLLYRNMRDGSFRDAAAEMGLSERAAYTAVAVGDVNKDGYPDLFLGRREERGIVALSDRQGRFRTSPAPAGSEGAIAAQFADYDNDGLLDLVMLFDRRVRIFRHGGGDRWSDAGGATPSAAGSGAAAVWQAMALGDADADGDQDIFVRESDGGLRMWRNEGGNANASQRVTLAARVSNRSGVGAKVEVRAGSLRQVLETSAASPAVAPADVGFGLGPRPAAGVVRVLWPSGILQAETTVPAAPRGAGRRPPLSVAELDRKPSSCPYLFTWNGTRFEFVTDFMGGGEMGAWLAPATWNQPDPDEYVRIDAQQLQPRDGRYELRVTNELEEALFVDQVELVAVDHAAGVDVYPNEGLRSAPRPPFALTAVRAARPPRRAADEHGHDVLDRIAAIDRRYPDDFRTLPIRGYAEAHELVLDLGELGGAHPVLLLTGWTDYAFSNDNVAASQSRIAMAPPSLQVKDAAGRWQTVVEEIGFPVGRPQTVVVDLRGKFLSGDREVRILTNMRIYWDRILAGEAAESAAVHVTRRNPSSAALRWRGLSAEMSPDGREPFGYDYHRVSTRMPWKTMIGRYTREGDVRPLLRQADDLFVISKPGDEIAMSFDALPEPASGMARTFLLYAYGYSKEMNPRSASPDLVGPLPFRAMTAYPYGDGEHYPRGQVHRDYQDRYNTRTVHRPIPSIDADIRR